MYPLSWLCWVLISSYCLYVLRIYVLKDCNTSDVLLMCQRSRVMRAGLSVVHLRPLRESCSHNIVQAQDWDMWSTKTHLLNLRGNKKTFLTCWFNLNFDHLSHAAVELTCFLFPSLLSLRLKDKTPKTNRWILSHEDSANPLWCQTWVFYDHFMHHIGT